MSRHATSKTKSPRRCLPENATPCGTCCSASPPEPGSSPAYILNWHDHGCSSPTPAVCCVLGSCRHGDVNREAIADGIGGGPVAGAYGASQVLHQRAVGPQLRQPG